MLFLASFIALYFELLVIRYIGTELAVFLSLKNLPLIASFFGLGVGMLRTGRLRRVQRTFALTAAALFLVIRFRAYVPQPSLGWQYQLVQGKFPHWLSFATYVGFVLVVLWLIVLFFAALGDRVGEYLKVMPPLPGYGINLTGSLAGILGLTLLSFSGAPPLVWLAAGFALLVPLWWRRWSQLLVLAALVVATGLPPLVSIPPHRYSARNHRWRPSAGGLYSAL